MADRVILAHHGLNIFSALSLGDYVLIGLGIAFVWVIFVVDRWMVKSGWRIEPQDYRGAEPENPAIKRQDSGAPHGR